MKKYNLFNKNKKAQVADIAAWLVGVTAIVLTIILARFVYVNIQNAISSSEISTPAANKVMTDMSVMFPIFDNALIFIVIGLTIALLISSFLLPSHPIFLPVNIVGLFILVFLAAVLTNVYSNIISEPAINDILMNDSASGLTDYKASHFIMTRLPWLCAFVVFISTIVLYSKGRSDQINF